MITNTFLNTMDDNSFSLSQMTHELRNPLTIIYSTLQLIEHQHPDCLLYTSVFKCSAKHGNCFFISCDSFTEMLYWSWSIEEKKWFFRGFARRSHLCSLRAVWYVVYILLFFSIWYSMLWKRRAVPLVTKIILLTGYLNNLIDVW